MVTIGVFQLLPGKTAADDGDVIRQALWEVDFAESRGWDSVWITEHHLSGFGLIGAPSVYAAAVAQRTARIRIGFGVAVVPLHHPLRLAEEITWLDHLSGGRVVVGTGPGFSAGEFAAFGVPLEERHARHEEGLAIIRRALEHDVRPRPLTPGGPQFFRASSSEASLRRAAKDGTPILFGTKPLAELADRLRVYREVRTAMGIDDERIAREIAEMYVLRRICIAPTDAEAIALMRDADPEQDLATACCGSIETVRKNLDELEALGLRRIIGWFHFGNMPYDAVQRSMEALTSS